MRLGDPDYLLIKFRDIPPFGLKKIYIFFSRYWKKSRSRFFLQTPFKVKSNLPHFSVYSYCMIYLKDRSVIEFRCSSFSFQCWKSHSTAAVLGETANRAPANALRVGCRPLTVFQLSSKDVPWQCTSAFSGRIRIVPFEKLNLFERDLLHNLRKSVLVFCRSGMKCLPRA